MTKPCNKGICRRSVLKSVPMVAGAIISTSAMAQNLFAQTKLTHEVAKHRSRDLSSVIKQLETLNTTFANLCGECLVDTNTGRGKPVQFTRTGEEVVKLVEKFLEELILVLIVEVQLKEKPARTRNLMKMCT